MERKVVRGNVDEEAERAGLWDVGGGKWIGSGRIGGNGVWRVVEGDADVISTPSVPERRCVSRLRLGGHFPGAKRTCQADWLIDRC